MTLLNSTTIILSIAVFLIVVLLLVGLLVFVRNKLMPKGKVKITINGKKEVEVNPGSSLLSTLAEQQIFLPSACGGKGNCGQCKCRVVEGGGDILPTEKGFFSRKQVQDHWRLGCQVKVNEDLKIAVPESILGIKKWECEVVSNHNVATFIKEFVVKLPEGEKSFDFFDRLLGTCEVVGTPGSGFGPCGEGYFRLTAFGDHEQTKVALKRIKEKL